LREFTLKNPFEVREVTEGYVKLRNVGINPSITQLQQLADLAAASGKSFDTVTSSLLGATTGRFAQLKQFGITAKQQGDMVALTFRGVTTVVEKSQEAISSYILGLGALNGVAGATERIMNTTGGRITNLKDNFTELFNTIGEGTGGPIRADS
jgi:phage tail tape-measure protein